MCIRDSLWTDFTAFEGHAGGLAALIALTHELESPLALASEFVIGYQHGDAKRYAYTSAPILYRIIHALVDRTTSSSTLAPATDAVAALDGLSLIHI